MELDPSPLLEVNITLRLGPFELDARFTADNETIVLFGHSGSGKSVTLASIAGLQRPDSGRIRVSGRSFFDREAGIDLSPQERSVGFVVQHLALFPHLTVDENIAYGLRAFDRSVRTRRTRELIELFGLGGLEERLPAQISGGQQQRVALARALARPTSVLLLDEPFSALDEALRRDLRVELGRIRAAHGIPLVFVTHDLREAYLLGDRIAVLDRGQVLQSAPRAEVFERPASRRVAQLTGVANVFRGRAARGGVEVAGLVLEPRELVPSGEVDLAIRAERCVLRRLDPDSVMAPNCFVARVVQDFAFGNSHTVRLEPETVGPTVEVEVASRPYEILGVVRQPRWVVELPSADLHPMPVS